MVFEEKLIELRKKAGLSQEELAEKLNVTRQTISKWELGQSKPDLDKLMEMSKVFNIGMDELTTGNVQEKNIKTNKDVADERDDFANTKPRKWLLVLLIIIALGIVVVLADKVLKNQENGNGIFEFMNFNKSSFNQEFENRVGVKSGFYAEIAIEDIIENNSLNKDRIVKLTFEDETTDNIEKMTNIKSNLSTFKDYQVSLNYDEDGYVNEVVIKETLASKINTYNSSFKSISGDKWGTDICEVLEKVIANNKENSNIITVKYMNITSSKEEDIKKIKNSLIEHYYYNSTIKYTDDGYVSEIDIVECFNKNKSSFNSRYHSGTKMGVTIVSMLDNIIESNRTNTYHLISVKFKGQNTTDEAAITKIKQTLSKDWSDYEVTYNYDENGYVNQMVITKI